MPTGDNITSNPWFTPGVWWRLFVQLYLLKQQHKKSRQNQSRATFNCSSSTFYTSKCTSTSSSTHTFNVWAIQTFLSQRLKAAHGSWKWWSFARRRLHFNIRVSLTFSSPRRRALISALFASVYRSRCAAEALQKKPWEDTLTQTNTQRRLLTWESNKTDKSSPQAWTWRKGQEECGWWRSAYFDSPVCFRARFKLLALNILSWKSFFFSSLYLPKKKRNAVKNAALCKLKISFGYFHP